jgi:hypothetical protein
MSLPPSPRAPESAMQKEMRVFRQQIQRLINCFLNWVFDLTERGSRRRRNMLLFLLMFLALFLFLLTVRDWLMQYNNLFANFSSETLLRFILFLGDNLFGPETPRILVLVSLSFGLALEAAASYLDDIFELNRPDIARQFIWQVALAGNRKSIRIREGDIHPNDTDSPIYRIGGPGQVEVALDSVALFEKLDGRPHIIGPTVDGKVTLEGFERLRQVIHLRDQYPDALEVNGRSLDGIPVSSVDVRMFFSIWRENGQATIQRPYPFSQKAVETLTYGLVSRVNPSGPPWSTPPNTWDWVGTGSALIRGELGGFMGQHRLVEYLASIGLPEVQQARQHENEILDAGRAVVPEDDALQPRPIPTLPDFKARPIISNLFKQFAREFTERASNRGVELHWVGVGTWKMPTKITDDVITGKHLDAWRLSNENLSRSSPSALKELRQETRTQRIISQIQDVPLERFKLSSGSDHTNRERDLLIAYREQLIEAVELLRKSNKEVTGVIFQAIEYIEKTLGIEHWVR